MSYTMRIEFLAKDVPDVIKTAILTFLKTYDFPYVSSVQNKTKLQESFIDLPVL